MRIMLIGYGKMGKTIEAIAKERGNVRFLGKNENELQCISFGSIHPPARTNEGSVDVYGGQSFLGLAKH